MYPSSERKHRYARIDATLKFETSNDAWIDLDFHHILQAPDASLRTHHLWESPGEVREHWMRA